MQFSRDGGASWRTQVGRWIIKSLGHRVIDPVEQSRLLLAQLRSRGWDLSRRDRSGGDWDKFFRRVVDLDCRYVQSSDYVICYWNTSARRGAGTQGELTIARQARIPVFLVSRTPIERIPGWVQGCTTQHFNGFVSLREFLEKRFGTITSERV